MRFRTQENHSIRVQVVTSGQFRIATVVTTGDIDGPNPTHNVYEQNLDLVIAPSPGRPNEYLIRCFERISGSGIQGLKSTQVRKILDPDSPNFPPGADPNHRKDAYRTQNPGSSFDDAVLDVFLSDTDVNDVEALTFLQREKELTVENAGEEETQSERSEYES